MRNDNPLFVKVTGPGRYSIQPYSAAGWVALGLWILLHTGVLLLLLIPQLREDWWIIVALDLLVTLPFVLFAVRNAVPMEQLQRRHGKSKDRGGKG